MTAPTIARWPAVLACALLARAAHADFGDILQPYANASASIQYYAPMGQSFTAVSADFTTFGFRIEACNPSYPNNPLTYSLYAGETASGTPLATRQVSLPDGDNYVDADFSGVSLVPGQKYTMVLTAQSARGCVRLNGYLDNMPPANDYLGGSMLWEGTFYSGGDLTFRLIASPKADVQVSALGVSADPVLTGSTVTFQGSVFNDGPGKATAVQATLSLSGPGALLGVGSSLGSCTVNSPTTASCSLGDMNVLANADVGANVATTGAGTVTLSLSVQGTQTDPVAGNNLRSQSTRAGAGADLSVQIGAPKASLVEIDYGDVLAVVRNAGPGPVAGARVQVSVPGELYLARWSCVPSPGANCGSGGSYSVDDLVGVPAGGSVTYVIAGRPFDYTLDGYLLLGAQVGGGSQVELDGGNNAATVGIPLSLFRGDFDPP